MKQDRTVEYDTGRLADIVVPLRAAFCPPDPHAPLPETFEKLLAALRSKANVN
ncbi:hypothetical protein ACG74X_11550 [Marivita sp. S0852]|uniref:hypothetical protein n=1 Tax=Marivita sp. S0852 TaxID=3373893 RepID=UPI003982ACAB